jgi:hypothetical protein
LLFWRFILLVLGVFLGPVGEVVPDVLSIAADSVCDPANAEGWSLPADEVSRAL